MCKRCFVAIAGLFIAGAACAPRPSAHDPRRLAAEADVVFAGTIAVLQAATFDVDDAESLAIVRVSRVLGGDSSFAGLAGSDVTVQLREPARSRVGEERVYYAMSWHLGESIGVTELGSTVAPTQQDLERMPGDIERFRQEQGVEALRARLASAELVVRGRVIAVRRAERQREASEHDPDWQEADIEVGAVLRGSAGANTVTILFPGNQDVVWYRWPRPTVGAEAIWLLRPYDFAGQRLARLTAQPGDRVDVAQEAQVRQLLPR